jgi:hypothetical protein
VPSRGGSRSLISMMRYLISSVSPSPSPPAAGAAADALSSPDLYLKPTFWRMVTMCDAGSPAQGSAEIAKTGRELGKNRTKIRLEMGENDRRGKRGDTPISPRVCVPWISVVSPSSKDSHLTMWLKTGSLDALRRFWFFLVLVSRVSSMLSPQRGKCLLRDVFHCMFVY